MLHGILFQDEMVRALLRPPGDPLRKTVTRRTSDRWARVQVGDLLWVRECWRAKALTGAGEPVLVTYRAGGTRMVGRAPDDATWREERWTPSIHMPWWASRLTLRVVNVQQEWGNNWPDAPEARPGPLPCVDDAEARLEGVEDRAAYLRLWEAINGPDYPAWVWRIEFEKEGS